MLQNDIEAKIGAYYDIYLGRTLKETKALKRVSVGATHIVIEIVLGYPHQGIDAIITQDLQQLIQPLVPDKIIECRISSDIVAYVGKPGASQLPQVKNIIAVASGKGGVGKSTIAANLALALAQAGARVGLLDADIYGPSLPTMFGVVSEKPVVQDKKIYPINRYGLALASIGFFVAPDVAISWRGPMLGKALEQLVYDVVWDDLDYLIVDLPPGTGDVQLTLCQKMPVSGVVIVTTPQDVALADVRRACDMFNKLNVPILGVVENMSTYYCSHCGHEERLFGKGGGELLAEQFKLASLGSVPLQFCVRESADKGRPLVACEPKETIAQNFFEIARKVAARLSLQPRDYSVKFPKIVTTST